MTFTINTDGSITATGNPTATSRYEYNAVSLPKGKYIINGCPSGGTYGTDDGFYIAVFRISDQWVILGADSGSGVLITISEPSQIVIRIRIGSDCVLPNEGLTFYPMIRYADIEDDTYEPYIDDIQTQINDILARLNALEGGS